jgi:hypothetical protein
MGVGQGHKIYRKLGMLPAKEFFKSNLRIIRELGNLDHVPFRV